ncbi:DNA adenine methylase [Collinsella bouchesdurhonensis]|uniref:DNA adenine methylase n=1 Tax=Collinsella bouchesdurhonensis TaxID=1907654 RepID=UPI0035620EB4
MPITYTPIRYPGGKSKIYPLVDSIISGSGLDGCAYAEAYCGGAGLAMKLLLLGRVSRVILNDIDPAVYSMWDAIVNHPDELCHFIEEVELTIDEWKSQREVYASSDAPSLELGKAAFYLNRTNRSGILRGGPIGGMSQSGKYGIDARFNREALCRKIGSIAARSDAIELHNMDACGFIDTVLSGIDGLFANFDPPYVVKGPGLYENSYTEDDHREVAKKIAECEFPWIVTYDDAPLISELYGGFDRYRIRIGYSAASARTGAEVLIAGKGVEVPDGIEKC